MSGKICPTQDSTHLISWLMMVEYHSQSASSESLETLQELAKALPIQTADCLEVRQVIETINRCAPSKIYDPALASMASAALKAVELLKTLKNENTKTKESGLCQQSHWGLNPSVAFFATLTGHLCRKKCRKMS